MRRVIPIGDGLGRVIAEIIRHVKRFRGTDQVPICDHWNLAQKIPRPAAPYLIQAIRHPSPPGLQTIRSRIKAMSIAAGARQADGAPLILLPHDCRRVFYPRSSCLPLTIDNAPFTRRLRPKRPYPSDYDPIGGHLTKRKFMYAKEFTESAALQ